MTDVEYARWPPAADATRQQATREQIVSPETVRPPVVDRVAPPVVTPAPGAAAGLGPGDIGAVLNRGFITFAVAVVAFAFFLYTPSALQHGRDQAGLTRRFRAELATQRAPIGGVIPSGAPVALLEIPAIGVHEIVVQGTTSGVTRAGPGHLAASVLPGQPGNSVIIGRKTAYGGPFKHLSSLRAGDQIRVTTGQGTARYSVISEGTQPPGSARAMLPTTKARLTLVTSDPALFAKRYRVAYARLESDAFAPTGHASTIPRADLGLTGDPNAAATLFLWLLVAALVGFGAVVAWRRAPRAAAWLIVVPLVLAAGWLVFENLVVLLPATL
jgi:sortase A